MLEAASGFATRIQAPTNGEALVSTRSAGDQGNNALKVVTFNDLKASIAAFSPNGK
ncbi:hypothetical protein [Accumulibacter sp.]|jgi:hypothetical protein|uniref:hypothetical protein n=1 Tax=Accumulibacter sp. TaxID=2053492 RepID=UPI0026128A41|nr:hypothetical protein [Accumulibacter sp.]